MFKFLKNKMSYVIGVALLLSFIASVPANEASFEMGDDKLDLGIDFSNFEEVLATKHKQTMEEIKSNYLSVLELVKNKHYEQAKIKVTELIRQDPNQSIYYNLQALLQLVNKDLPGAEQSFLKTVELNPENTQALTGLSRLALYNKQLDSAKQYADKVLAINPHEVIAYQVLADVALQQQGMDAVEAILLDARVKVKDNPKAELAILQSLGKVYIRKNQPEKLLQLAADLIKRNKNDITALSFLAQAQLANKDETGAEKTLRQIIVQQPNDAEHLFLLARLLGNQKDKETEILGLLDKAALNIDNPALVLSYKAAVLIKQKHYKQAYAIAQQVDESNPAQSIGKILKGDVYLAQNKYSDAQLNYQQAYAITPNIKVLDAMLKILAQQNKPNDAVSLLEKELAANKDNPDIHYRLAIIYQATEQNDLAIQYYETVLAKQKDNVIVLNNLAYLYALQQNPKAISLAKQAYQLAPKSGAVADTYGYLLLKQGDKQESLKILKHAAESAPGLTEIQLHLAEAYIVNEDKLQAKAILQELLNNKTANVVEQGKARELLEGL